MKSYMISSSFRYIIRSVIATAAIYLLIRFLFLASFRIPSNSMNPTLIAGDQILVNKLIPGPRIFKSLDYFKTGVPDFFRINVFKVKRNDVVVFNNPFPDKTGTMSMNMKDYYVKRCVGLPGDSIKMENKPRFYIPRKGDRVELSPSTAYRYRSIIEFETGMTIHAKEDQLLLGGIYIKNYTFKHDYYFMTGDNSSDSYDSRYWGLLPSDFIVGKAFLIWRSKDLHTGKLDFSRIGKIIK